MSYNKYGELELLCDLTKSKPYFISRDKAGDHVLREGSSDGRELFSSVQDNGKRNTKKGRVTDVTLLLDKINECEA